MNEVLHGVLRCGSGLLGAFLIFAFFKSIIRVGILNQHFQDPVASWTGRALFRLFRYRIELLPGGRARKNEIMTWYWPCLLIGITTAWFLLVSLGFAFLHMAFLTEKSFVAALVASGSALSTLGFFTPSTVAGQFLAIFEGAIGLFIIVYLFTFLPGFLDLLRERGNRVAWIYHRTSGKPSGVALLTWMARNAPGSDLSTMWEEWAAFFHTMSNSRSFLPVLCVVRPLSHDYSWVCAFGSFLDALALQNTTVAGSTEHSAICFENGVAAVRNTHEAMRGAPIKADRDKALVHVKRAEYDAACAQLEASGVKLVEDREAAWQEFVKAHMVYEEEIAWLAAAITDPVPNWPQGEAR